MPGKITAIPATRALYTLAPIDTVVRKKVAAYARVSTDEEEQQNSYESQIRYYSEFIQKHPDWDFVKVYADEGISGTRTAGRDGFNSMISDALAGRIDLIITKSVSRFARNTVDSLSIIRQLKERGVEVYFEKENIYTMDSKGELLLTIMSSLAQEESRSISENVTWGKRRAAAEGKFNVAYSHFLGYDKGMKINEEQAVIVRRIYQEFLEGKSPNRIADGLTADGIPTPYGKKIWAMSTVISILSNVKYKGDVHIQKTFTTNFLTHKSKINEGEVPQYYITGNHEAIIAPEVFDRVQMELAARKNDGRKHFTPHTFSGFIFCGDCGGLYNNKAVKGNIPWRCRNKWQHLTQCQTHQITTRALENAFVTVFNQLIENKEEIYAICEQAMAQRFSTADLDAMIEQRQNDLEVYVAAERKVIMKAGRDAAKKYAEMKQHETDLQTEIAGLQTQRMERMAKLARIREYMDTLRASGRITEFDPQLWYHTVERVTMTRDGIRFEFKDGTVIEG